MPQFLRSAAERLEYLGPEPDRWRAETEPTLSEAQGPDHYIDLELLTDFGELPRGRYDFISSYAKQCVARGKPVDECRADRVGFEPYITLEVYERLKVAFREYRRLKAAELPTGPVEEDIVFYAGCLSHYVADGSEPLHTTIHHHGWVGPNPHHYTTDSDIHSKFETRFVARAIDPSDVSKLVHVPVRLADPFADYLKYLHRSNSRVEKLYQIEQSRGFDGPGSKEARVFVTECLAAGSQMLLNLWYTAWVESAN